MRTVDPRLGGALIDRRGALAGLGGLLVASCSPGNSTPDLHTVPPDGFSPFTPFGLSGDGKTVCFLLQGSRRGVSHWWLHVTPIERASLKLVRPNGLGFLDYVSLNHDGTKIVGMEIRVSGKTVDQAMVIIDIATNTFERVWKPADIVYGTIWGAGRLPRFSPDASRIAFAVTTSVDGEAVQELDLATRTVTPGAKRSSEFIFVRRIAYWSHNTLIFSVITKPEARDGQLFTQRRGDADAPFPVARPGAQPAYSANDFCVDRRDPARPSLLFETDSLSHPNDADGHFNNEVFRLHADGGWEQLTEIRAKPNTMSVHCGGDTILIVYGTLVDPPLFTNVLIIDQRTSQRRAMPIEGLTGSSPLTRDV